MRNIDELNEGAQIKALSNIFILKDKLRTEFAERHFGGRIGCDRKRAVIMSRVRELRTWYHIFNLASTEKQQLYLTKLKQIN